MEIVGYCLIRKNQTTGISVAPMDDFIGHPCRCYEFADDGGVLCINPSGTALATFDSSDIKAYFKCSVIGDIICPPDLNFADQLQYYTKVMTRKGGYHPVLYNMIVWASLRKGRFCDNVLWEKQ